MDQQELTKQFIQSRGTDEQQRLHGKDTRTYQCDVVCDKQFTHRRSLVRHQPIHNDQKPYQCAICDKRFTHRGGLVDHQWIHNNVKPYQCDVCDKQFTRKGHLVEHQRIHNNEKPYQWFYTVVEYSLHSTIYFYSKFLESSQHF